ncbi:fimbria/pilus outer membrane usher protein [Burkholderia contaminans]|uniref:fimbria/pilus outer membrane usher protein n=1 Tax=Burkholderia contaminans TaxID=488447 RepID=UPI002417221B|nr:fimbria/pilus outer membrane usher protein [Burkholderia contaminans]WFN14777.1 fimbria/pilus outer membrane usher protein [Burkholderia contaminans]
MRVNRASRRSRRQRESSVYCGGTAASLLLLLAGTYSPRAQAEVDAAPDTASSAAQATAEPAAADALFDTSILQQRGLDPQIADYFRGSPRYRPGHSRVVVYVNDIRRGRINTRFDENGALCFDRAFLDAAGLVVPDTKYALPGDPEPDACYDFAQAFPGTDVTLKPGREEVRLVVPTTALRQAVADFSGYSRGGNAALLNYELMTMRSESSGMAGSNFLSLNTELGVNAGDWILRSRAYSQREDHSGFQSRHLYAYGQRTWLRWGATAQVGQINIANSVLTGAPLTGIQVFPDSALGKQARNIVMVEGVAQSQARVEVRQAGALIYTTVVPVGPFALTDLPLLNNSSDLEVTVIESDGARRSFLVPAASISAGALGQRPGYAFALGKSRNLDGNKARNPWVASASGNWTLGKRGNVGMAALFAPGYQAGSWGVDMRLSRASSVKLQQRVSLEAGKSGTEIEVSGIFSGLHENLSMSFSSAYQSNGYRTLDDFTVDTGQAGFAASRYRSRHTAALAWSDARLGGLTFGYSFASQQNGERTQRLNLSWGKSFAFGTVSLNVERDLSPRREGRYYGSNAYDRPGNTYYASLSIPFGKRTVRSYASNTSGYTRFGASYSERIGDNLNYSVNVDRNTRDRSNAVAGQMAATPRIAQVNLGFSDTGKRARSYYAGASGGVVVHADGVTLSPYPVQDTFAIVSASGVSNVKINTPQGPVWTDLWGRAVVPRLSPYSSNRVEVMTSTLPRNVDIGNGTRQVDPGRGSVNRIDFELARVRRVLLNARDADGNPLPAGAYVLDSRQRYVGMVLEQGQVFLNNGAGNEVLQVALPDGKQCRLQYALPEPTGSGALFESADARCILQ